MSISHGRRFLRLSKSTKKMPAAGSKNTTSRDARNMPFGLSREAAHAGTLIANVNGTVDGPGTIVGGVKVQVAPDGKELFRHDNVIGCFAFPVFAMSDVAYIAEPPADTVCGAG